MTTTALMAGATGILDTLYQHCQPFMPVWHKLLHDEEVPNKTKG